MADAGSAIDGRERGIHSFHEKKKKPKKAIEDDYSIPFREKPT
jgi:hypothetical protein